MKKCPTCEKTFEDSMRFCQMDGTPLVDDAPAFDPYATIVAQAFPVTPAPEPEPVVAAAESTPEQDIHYTVGSIPISEPDDVLDLPSNDPLKTMYVLDAEMEAALGKNEPDPEPEIIEIPPIEEVSRPEPPSFIAPEPPASFYPAPPPSPFEPTPPPSPFAVESVAEEPATPVSETPFVSPPVFKEPERFDEAATIIQPGFTSPFEQAPAPIAQWTPPPAPEANWQNQEIGSNTPFQTPVAVMTGQSKTLAIVSLVCGIVGFLCCSTLFVVGAAAIVTGFMARGKANANPNEFGGSGMALAGIILGSLSLVIGVLYWIFVFSGALSLPNF